MTEYIVNVPDEEAEYFIARFGLEGTTLMGYHLTGEIVRCRDCENMFDWAYDRPMCKLWAMNDPDESNSSSGSTLYPVVKPDGFCAWGKRKEVDA